MRELTTGQTVVLGGDETLVEVDPRPGGLPDSGLSLVAFALDDHGQAVTGESLLQEGSQGSASGSIRFHPPGGVILDLRRLPPPVAKVAIAVVVRIGPGRGVALNAFQEIETRIQDADPIRYRLDCRDRPEAALILVELYRRAGGWKARAVGQGFVWGLRKLAEHFGLALPDSPEVPSPPSPGSSHAGSEAPFASGTGFCVHPEGYLLTNHHVIEDGNRFEAVSSRVRMELQLVFADPTNDLALLQADRSLPAITFRDGRSVGIGEQVMAVGFPLGGILGTAPSVTIGNVSSLVALGDDTRSLRFTAPIQMGNSGGPLLDLSGLVVGTVSAKLAAARIHELTGDLPENVNFALKTALVRSFLEAAGIDCQLGMVTPPRPTGEIAQEACRFVYRIQCRR